jgi:MOSC domain-containing protein YiiM
MKLVSVNVSLPREVVWHAETVSTAIFKQPVAGRIALTTLNLAGDRQADLTVHGGPDKAVYGYPFEHYALWKRELPERDFPIAVFGENFTTEGMSESSVHIGDRFAIGTAEFIVTQPRMPCYKLGIRFGSDDMVKLFLASGRTGFYFAVAQTGPGFGRGLHAQAHTEKSQARVDTRSVAAGDTIERIAADPRAVPVSEITRLYIAKKYSAADVSSVRRALEVPALPESWKDYFRSASPSYSFPFCGTATLDCALFVARVVL